MIKVVVLSQFYYLFGLYSLCCVLLKGAAVIKFAYIVFYALSFLC